MNISVLVIEDEDGLAGILKQYLVSFGYKAFTQNDGEAGVDFYKEHKPDITMIDILLGENSIDGIEVLRRIREINPEAVCIMATRITDEPTAQKAKTLGAKHYILKPYSGQDVLEIVNEEVKLLLQKGAGNGQ